MGGKPHPHKHICVVSPLAEYFNIKQILLKLTIYKDLTVLHSLGVFENRLDIIICANRNDVKIRSSGFQRLAITSVNMSAGPTHHLVILKCI